MDTVHASELDTLRRELHAIVEELAKAVENVDGGVSLDLAALGPRAAHITDRILKLPTHEALSLMDELVEAVKMLEALQQQLANR